MDRRSFITVATAAPLVALPAIAEPDQNAKLLKLIARLEILQGWEAGSTVWRKAWAADEIRKAMGIEPIEDERQHNYVQHCKREYARNQEWLKTYGDWRST